MIKVSVMMASLFNVQVNNSSIMSTVLAFPSIQTTSNSC
jgi:hypothetical protein